MNLHCLNLLSFVINKYRKRFNLLKLKTKYYIRMYIIVELINKMELLIK